MLSACAPVLAESGDKLYRGMIIVLQHMAPYIQSQPFCPRRIRFQRGWPGAAVPGIEQIIELVQHKGAVSTAHKGLRIGRQKAKRAVVPALAAAFIAC